MLLPKFRLHGLRLVLLPAAGGEGSPLTQLTGASPGSAELRAAPLELDKSSGAVESQIACGLAGHQRLTSPGGGFNGLDCCCEAPGFKRLKCISNGLSSLTRRTRSVTSQSAVEVRDAIAARRSPIKPWQRSMMRKSTR
jgi:hypothetical protein